MPCSISYGPRTTPKIIPKKSYIFHIFIKTTVWPMPEKARKNYCKARKYVNICKGAIATVQATGKDYS